jgi:hypothetical protein
MKKIFITTLALLSLSACGKTNTVYVVDSLPEDLEVTQAPATTKPKPRPTTTVYNPPINYYSNDEQAYINGVYSMYNNTIYLSDDDLLGIAYTICSTLDTGVSIEAVVAVISASMPNMSTDTMEFISATMASAIYNICPQHIWQIPTN